MSDDLGDYELFILNADRPSEEWAERMLTAADLERKDRRENPEQEEERV